MGAVPALPELRAAWLELEARSACSFFISWRWIGTWLALICHPHHARLLSVFQDGQRVAMGLFTQRRRFYGLGPRHLRLHETGDRVLDSLTIEYNGLLCERGHEREALAAVIDHLARNDRRWLTLYLPGIIADEMPFENIRSHGISMRVRRHAARYVDLDALRESGADYMQTVLSSNTRSAVRRTARKIEAAHGPLELVVAGTPAEKMAFFHAMAKLHEAHWSEEEDRHGAFSDPRILRFHETLVAMQDGDDGVQLVRVCAGDETVGYVYNLVWRGVVYFYQAGIDYRRFGAYGSPGLLLISRSIEQSLAAGASRFELMAGDSDYKRMLGMVEAKMVWLSLDRDGVGSALRKAWWRLKHGRQAA